MNIKILDSWLREYLETNASPQEIAKELSLTSVSIEKIEQFKKDHVYDIEITTNRPDLAGVNGLAREAGAVLIRQGIRATYKPLRFTKAKTEHKNELAIQIESSLVNRVCAVVMEVQMGKSPQIIQDRLEASGIRSLNNLVDITNYVMRTTGQPTHVFDYDRLKGTTLKIREAKKSEKITTLDNKTYTLLGGEVVAENEHGEIVDLLAVMGLANSVVTEKTKRIVFFVNNIDSVRVRKTSMSLGIRTEAAQLNEKHLDPNLCETALYCGIQMYKELARGRVTSEIIDMYPHKPEEKQIFVSLQKISRAIGVAIPEKQSIDILSGLGFGVEQKDEKLFVSVPPWRLSDISLPEDIIEEIARVYGYHNLPGVLPLLNTFQIQQQENSPFYWEQRIKNALKYWGFSEVYAYSMVPEVLYEGPLEEAVTIANPLSEEFVYMRKTLVPSLLHIISENKKRDMIRIFEIANVYHKKTHQLPKEVRMLAGVVKHTKNSFFLVKGYIEQLFRDLGISDYSFKPTDQGGDGAGIFIANNFLGEIEILDQDLINFEINFDQLLQYVSLSKTYIPPGKYPPIIEDIALNAPIQILTGDIIKEIRKLSKLISSVSLLDRFADTRTFHVVYQDSTGNLTNEEVKNIHNTILQSLNKKWGIKEKG